MSISLESEMLYLAPMRGITDHVFRRIYTTHFGGFDLAVAPFIASKKHHQFKTKYVRDVLPENNRFLPVIPQILGNSALDFGALANYLHDLGYETVNWNLGCPFPMVAKKARGSGLLPHSQRIADFLDALMPRLKGSLSIKLRLGWSSARDILNLIPILNAYPLKEIMIHPRTGLQRYEGKIDLMTLARCLDLTVHSVVYNGNLRTYADYVGLTQQYPGIKKWMIGRGCLFNPFLPLCIKEKNRAVPDKRLRMARFHDELMAGYADILDGPSHLLNKMKGFWQYWAMPFAAHEKPVKMIKKALTLDQYRAAVDAVMACEAQWEPLDGVMAS